MDSNGCLIDDCGLFYTGVKEAEQQHQVEVPVYPNPATNQFTLTYTSKYNLPIKPQAIVYNLQGQVMQEVSLNGNSWQEQISVASYPSGMYIYQVVSGTQVLVSGKILVE